MSRIASGSGRFNAVVEFPLGNDAVICDSVYGAEVFFTRFILVFSENFIIRFHVIFETPKGTIIQYIFKVLEID
jgi:hypothetical protein